MSRIPIYHESVKYIGENNILGKIQWVKKHQMFNLHYYNSSVYCYLTAGQAIRLRVFSRVCTKEFKENREWETIDWINEPYTDYFSDAADINDRPKIIYELPKQSEERIRAMYGNNVSSDAAVKWSMHFPNITPQIWKIRNRKHVISMSDDSLVIYFIEKVYARLYISRITHSLQADGSKKRKIARFQLVRDHSCTFGYIRCNVWYTFLSQLTPDQEDELNNMLALIIALQKIEFYTHDEIEQLESEIFSQI